MNLSSLDLNLLLVLDAVLAERSVARAAKRLHVTPPAVSNALGRLRAALGDPIVTRSGRGIVPTPRALELGPKIRRALADIDRALHGEPFDARTADRQITLGIADAGQLGKLPSIARALAEEMPRARLRVVHVDTMVMLGGVGGTEVDVAIGVSPAGPSLHRRKLFDERFVVVARRDHPRIGARARKRDLAEASHVQVHVSLGQENRAIGAAYASLGIARRTTAIVPTFAAALAVAGATDAIATIPESVVAVIGESIGVRVVSSPLAVAPLAMHMTWHERTHRDPALTCFRELVTRALGAGSR